LQSGSQYGQAAALQSRKGSQMPSLGAVQSAAQLPNFRSWNSQTPSPQTEVGCGEENCRRSAPRAMPSRCWRGAVVQERVRLDRMELPIVQDASCVTLRGVQNVSRVTLRGVQDNGDG